MGAMQRTPIHSRLVVGAVVLGIVLVVSGPWIVFPIGCGFAISCPASPEGWWSTNWLNVLVFDLGVVLVGWGIGVWRSGRSFSVPLDVALTFSGIVFVVLGLSVGYSTSCPGNGCPPLTASQWWNLFWPDVIADTLGVILVVVGSVTMLLARRKPVSNGSASESLRP